MGQKIRVLVVDDAAVVREALSQILNADPGIEVIATAADPYIAAQKMERMAPDVITLDVEMPRMDGLTFLQKIMAQHPMPVIMCSSLVESGSETVIKALEYGAVDIIQKPRMGTKLFLEESRVRICDAVKAAARARVAPTRTRPSQQVEPKLTADAVMPANSARRGGTQAMAETTEKVVVVGASTGGTEALREFLMQFPMDAPGIVVVQHMPENFTAAFARRLDSLCNLTVKEAADGDTVIRGRALIAPGNRHTLLQRSGARYYVTVKDGPLVSRHRPSVDVLFRSAARYAGRNCIGVIMTGMGDDGARGMKEMKDAGAMNLAQDEATCVVYGMPKEAVKAGGVDYSLPLSNIAAKVISLSR
ncbi:MAG: chemotaxis response regulator protein-glutamate methylesterase [Desulfuromonadaceae bacterium]